MRLIAEDICLKTDREAEEHRRRSVVAIPFLPTSPAHALHVNALKPSDVFKRSEVRTGSLNAVETDIEVLA